MEAVRIEFEPFIDQEARQFIVNGVDYYNIAATSLPDYVPVHGEFVNYAAIGIWNRPWQWRRHA